MTCESDMSTVLDAPCFRGAIRYMNLKDSRSRADPRASTHERARGLPRPGTPKPYITAYP